MFEVHWWTIQQRMPTQPQGPLSQNPFHAQSRPTGYPNPNTNTNPRRNFPERKLVKFTLISMPYADLLPSLLSNQRWLGGAKTVSPVSLALLNEGGKF